MELETYKTAKELIQKAGNTEYMINCLQNNTYAGIKLSNYMNRAELYFEKEGFCLVIEEQFYFEMKRQIIEHLGEP